MKKQNVKLVFNVKTEETCISLKIAGGHTRNKLNEDDVLVLNMNHTIPLYFQVLETSTETSSETTVYVKYFGSKKVLKRAAIYGASIVPLEDCVVNYNCVVACMLHCELQFWA